MEGRPVRESISEYVELALPNDTNALGTLLGGKVMHIADVAGALAAACDRSSKPWSVNAFLAWLNAASCSSA